MIRTLALVVVILLFFQTHVLAQTTGSKLILQTSPEVTEIELKDSVLVGTDGTITATPVSPDACNATGSCEGVSVSVTEFSFEGTQDKKLSVDEGDSVELVWKSLGATACETGGTFGPWAEQTSVSADSRDAATSERILSTQNTASATAYELKLQCSNGSVRSEVDSTSTLTLTVNEVVEPSPSSCEGRAPISGWTRLTTGSLSCLYGDFSADCRYWSPNLWPNSFLETGTLTRKILTNRNDMQQYVAIEFSTKGMSPSADGRFNFTSAGGVINQQPLIVTLSKCPGDFNPDQPNGCYFTPDFNFKWRGPESKSFSECVLEPDTIYYLNMLSSKSPAGTLPSKIEPIEECDGSLCGVLLQKN